MIRVTTAHFKAGVVYFWCPRPPWPPGIGTGDTNNYHAGMDRFTPQRDPAHRFASLFRPLAGLAVLLFGLWFALWPDIARASDGETDITLQARHWTDPSGGVTIDEVAGRPADSFEAMERYRSFALDGAALWLRLELPPRDAGRRWSK
eukprot:Opistho-2@67325